jgi:hypothetical protein
LQNCRIKLGINIFELIKPLLIMLKQFLLIFLLSLLPFARGYSQYQVNERCHEAWEALIDLRIETAKDLVNQEIQEHPKNYYAYYLAQLCDAYLIAINGSQEMYEQFNDDFEKRRAIMDDQDMESPYYLACESEMLLHMAAFGVMFGDRLSGIRKGYRSYKKIYENIKKFPDFKPNLKLEGFYNIAISNLPPFVQWAVSAFGVNGDSKTGFRLLQEYFESVEDERGLNGEAALYVILAYKLNKQPVKAYEFIKDKDSSLVNLRIINYFYANTAYRSGHNEEALEVLENFNPENAEVFFLPYDYMMGKILLTKGDNRAEYHLKRYLQLDEKSSYIKEINYKLALNYLIRGNVEQFEYYKEKACDEGADVNERDREAMYDCSLDYTPDIGLTRCKLLLDGGYHKEFADLFYTLNINEQSPIYYQLEYTLLKARYEEVKGNLEEAEQNYMIVIASGEDEDYYFASEAALRLGLMHLDDDRTKARKYLERARDLYDSDYYEYIDEIAKREIGAMDQ